MLESHGQGEGGTSGLVLIGQRTGVVGGRGGGYLWLHILYIIVYIPSEPFDLQAELCSNMLHYFF
jgi:hypothetical protein